jgi:RimJ/RimL family protein N-acetyltransferase
VISFRAATLADAERLFRWRNDAATRAASLSTGPVAWQEHVAWLGRALDDPDRRLLVAEEGGEPVGTVRFDRGEQCWTMSWTVAPEHRHQGIGKRMVRGAAEIFGAPLMAVVRSHNVESAKIAAAAGFVQAHASTDATVWTYSGKPEDELKV